MVSFATPILDLLGRTLDNLSHIECQKKKGYEVWETTQLINSFAGVVAYPWEQWSAELKGVMLDSEKGSNWPTIVALDERDEKPQSVGDLVRLVRNSFAHGNIQFHDDPSTQEIVSLTIWNTNPNSGLRTWAAELEIETLRSFLKAMQATVDEFREPSQPSIPMHHAERPGIDKPMCIACGQKVKNGNNRYDKWYASLPRLIEKAKE